MAKINVPNGKRLFVDWLDKPKGEFHGPREVEVPDGITTELLDELPGPTPEEIVRQEASQYISSTNDQLTGLVERVVSLLKAGDAKLTGLTKEETDFLSDRAEARAKVPLVFTVKKTES